MMQLAKLLYSKGFHITFVNTEFNHKRLSQSNGEACVRGLPRFRFKTILDGLPPRMSLPCVKVIIADGVMSFGMKAAEELGIPGVRFWTASACGMMGYFSYSDLKKRGICPFKGDDFDKDGTLDNTVEWIPGMPRDIRLKDLPSFLRTSDPNDMMFNFMGSEAQSCFQASSIIFNTFDDLEHEVLEEIHKSHPHIFPDRSSVLARTSACGREQVQVI